MITKEQQKQLIDNPNSILKNIYQMNDIKKLKNFLLSLSKLDNSSDFEMIRESVIKRINELEKKTINDVVDENPNLKDFEIIETLKDINDKDNYGFRHDTYYLKYNNVVYEISYEYLDNVKGLLSSVSKDMSKEDIFELLKPYLNELDNIEIKDDDGVLDQSDIEKEIEQIDDRDSRELYQNNISDVLEERKKLQEYIKENKLEDLTLTYGINENGERIYTLGEETFKFSGDNKREMYKLKSSGNEKESINVDESEKTDNVDNLDAIEFNKEENINTVNEIIVKMGNNQELDDKEKNLINAFFIACLFSFEKMNENASRTYNNFITSVREYNDLDSYSNYLSSDVIEGLERKINEVIEKNNNTKVKKLENNKYGFIDITLIVCSIILTIIMFLYIFIVK